MLPTRNSLQCEIHTKIESEGMEKDISCKRKYQENGASDIHIRQYKLKKIHKDKGQYIMIKESIQEQDIILINIYAPNPGAPKYIKQMLTDMKREFDNNNRGF